MRSVNLEELAGQSLMFGIRGAKLTPEILLHFKKTHARGLIVFRPNFESPEAFTKLISGLEESLNRRLLIAVDHEGGRVIHLAGGVTVFPDNLSLGHAGDAELAARQGEIEAAELRRLGLDLNLAPTVDVLTENFSPNIGIRSYGRDPELVSAFSVRRIKAMQSDGLSACAKHFPGQGQSPVDAHMGLPILPTSWEELRAIHLKPFMAAIEAGVDTIMSSHPVYPALDPSGVPATFSRCIIHDLLREELKYKGVILSDDLEMGALRNLCSIGESAVKALEAGHDMVLVCHDVNAEREVFQAVLEALRSGRLNRAEREKSAERIEALLRKRENRFASGELKPEQGGETLAKKIAADGILIENEKEFAANLAALGIEKGILPPAAIFFPRLSSLSDRIMIEPEMQNEDVFIRGLLDSNGIPVQKIIVENFGGVQTPGPDFVKTVRAAEFIIYFCYDAHLFEADKSRLETIAASGKPACVILLRDPYDRQWVKPPMLCVTAFGFRKVQIEAAVQRLFSVLREQVLVFPSPFRGEVR